MYQIENTIAENTVERKLRSKGLETKVLALLSSI